MSIAENTLPRPEMSEDVISHCQSQIDRLNLSRDVEISRREFAEGKGIPPECFDTVPPNVGELRQTLAHPRFADTLHQSGECVGGSGPTESAEI